MTPTADKLSAIALAVALVVVFMAIAFGLGYLVGKILL